MNVPIALTLVRIVLVPLVIVFLISSERVHVLIAAAIFLAASLTDWLDGAIARRTNQVTRLGTMLDPVADHLNVLKPLDPSSWWRRRWSRSSRWTWCRHGWPWSSSAASWP